MDLTYFKKVTGKVIDHLEGGYFHPNMRTANPLKFGAYHRSGETMFGLDRHAGHDLYYKTPRKASTVLANLPFIESGIYEYKNKASELFWKTIDNANAKNIWKWNYKGGDLSLKLKDLAATIIYNQFIFLFKKYLSLKAQQIVESNEKLLFHFIYATWNGSGWFQKFATIFNKEVLKTTDINELIKVVLNSRINSGNSLIKQGGLKIKKLFDSNFNTTVIDTPINPKPNIIGFLVILTFLGYLYVKNKF